MNNKMPEQHLGAHTGVSVPSSLELGIVASTKLQAFLAKIRTAVADYMFSEGCSCCQDVEPHNKHREALRLLLGVPEGESFLDYRTPSTE